MPIWPLRSYALNRARACFCFRSPLPMMTRLVELAIAEATGCKPPSGRCCVVDKSGNVVAVCNADPALDSHPHGQLIAEDIAVPGDRYITGAFSRPFER
jgi:hypothetical protein